MKVILTKKNIPGFEKGTIFIDKTLEGGGFRIINHTEGIDIDSVTLESKFWIQFLLRENIYKEYLYVCYDTELENLESEFSHNPHGRSLLDISE